MGPEYNRPFFLSFTNDGGFMEAMDIVNVALRWTHVIAGILWLGFLFFFVFILKPMMPTLDPPVRGGLMKGLIPRMMSWLGGIVGMTLVTGILLLGVVFHAGKLMFEADFGWGPLPGILIVLVFAMFGPYDAIARSPLSRNGWVLGVLYLVVTMGMLYTMTDVAGMTYRASMLHIGIMLGMIMAANGFMRVAPAQRRMLSAVQEGKAPDPQDQEIASQRAEHNAYMALPVIWTMLNQHTVVPGSSSHLWFFGVLVVSVAVVALIINRTSK